MRSRCSVVGEVQKRDYRLDLVVCAIQMHKETEVIRARFADPQPRMFPVAVTFLVGGRLAREGH
jgi:hypothetical protein